MNTARRFVGLWALAAASAFALPDVDVPYVTTPDRVTLAMLKLAQVGADDHVVDLGSGDGRIPIVAARRFGATALGVEIVPELVHRSRENAQRAGVAQRVEFREQDLFATDLSRATVVTLYLLPEVNLRLRPTLLALAPGTRVVSHDWDMGEWRPDRTLTLPVPEKKVGTDKASRVHLWVVPARVAGRWCSGPAALELRQAFQRVQAELRHGRGTAPLRFDARVQALQLRSQRGAFALALRDGALHVTRARGAFAPWRGAVFARCG